MRTTLNPKVTSIKVQPGKHIYQIEPEDRHSLVHWNGLMQEPGKSYLIEDDLLVFFIAPTTSDSITLLRLW